MAKKKQNSPSKGTDLPAKQREKSGGNFQLVIVESPAKAKTIEKYLGDGFKVRASVGHIRDLPAKAPKGVKQPVPGVDLETFEPTYEVYENKKAAVAELRKLAKSASEVWFATDLDREGEAIAWHLTQLLGIDPSHAKRVTFDAVTKADVQDAFKHPRPINMDRVNAQQARRLLDRIVGYLVSPVLWKKVATGLSAGRVQSPATRLIVDREREIEAFTPDESWDVSVGLALDASASATLSRKWDEFHAQIDDRGRGPLVRQRMAWLAEHGGLECELIEVANKPLKIEATKDSQEDLTRSVIAAVEAAGMVNPVVKKSPDTKGKGRAKTKFEIVGSVDPATRYRVESIDTTRKAAKPYPPFITSTLQRAASSRIGYATDRTMRVAQGLYEGIDIPGEGRVGLITYMRTDSTHLSSEAISKARSFIGSHFGAKYLPDAPRYWSSSNKAAQEAHEAIRPTDPARTPESLARTLTEEQLKLYTLIWRSFVACQMVDAQWNSTAVRLQRNDKPTGAVLKANGRTLVFDGFYKAFGVPGSDNEQTLPTVTVGQETGAFAVEPEQKFSSPPARYNEGSLVEKLEEAGIGRPSTYASIIRTIQDREYVEQEDRRFYATQLGMAVNDLLVEAFRSNFIEINFTRDIEAELDSIAEAKEDWQEMLRNTHKVLQPLVEKAANLKHMKAHGVPAPYACPKCGSRTEYRLGKNGRFLSCCAYPDCKYANAVNREGVPLLPEELDLLSPNGIAMIKRHGRFGEFLVEDLPRPETPKKPRKKKAKSAESSESPPSAEVASVPKPLILNVDKKGGLKLPASPPLVTDIPCPRCQSPMNLRSGKRGPWLGCSKYPKCKGREGFAKLDPKLQAQLERDLVAHLAGHSKPVVTRRDGTPIPEGTLIASLSMPHGVQNLAIHPDFSAQQAAQ